MIQITPQMRVLVAIEPADFRRGIDGIAALCRDRLRSDPMTGTVFVFRNRRATSVKLLVFDGQGFWLCQKRLSEGRFRNWPHQDGDAAGVRLRSHELAVLLAAGDPSGVQAPPDWRPVTPEP